MGDTVLYEDRRSRRHHHLQPARGPQRHQSVNAARGPQAPRGCSSVTTPRPGWRSSPVPAGRSASAPTCATAPTRPDTGRAPSGRSRPSTRSRSGLEGLEANHRRGERLLRLDATGSPSSAACDFVIRGRRRPVRDARGLRLGVPTIVGAMHGSPAASACKPRSSWLSSPATASTPPRAACARSRRPRRASRRPAHRGMPPRRPALRRRAPRRARRGKGDGLPRPDPPLGRRRPHG